jgi:hypothetical protein
MQGVAAAGLTVSRVSGIHLSGLVTRPIERFEMLKQALLLAGLAVLK